MKSAAEALTDMYGVRCATVPTQQIITCLLYTLNSAGLLQKAFEDIEQLTPLHMQKNEQQYISSITKLAEMVGLSDKPKALQLVIALLPYTLNTEKYGLVQIDKQVLATILNRSGKGHIYSELRKLLRQINALDLGYKILQTTRTSPINEFHIVRYTTKAELIDILTENRLMTPSTLDKLLS